MKSTTLFAALALLAMHLPAFTQKQITEIQQTKSVSSLHQETKNNDLGIFDRTRFEEQFKQQLQQNQHIRKSESSKNILLLKENFDSSNTLLDQFTIIDINQDDYTWEYDNESDYGGSQGTVSYKYSRKNDANDWLMSPSFHFKANHEYTIDFSFWASRVDVPETLEVKYGKTNTPEGMTVTIMPPTETTAVFATKETKSIVIKPTEDGEYFIGFHAMTKADHYDLYLDDIEVWENAFQSAPGAITDLVLTAGAKGGQTVNISFKSPTLSADNTPLEKLDKIEIVRNNKLVKTFTTPDIGETIEFTDNAPDLGWNKYVITAYNQDNGKPTEKEVFVGEDLPAEVSQSKYDDSSATLKTYWTPVTTGANQGYVDPEVITYTIAEAFSDPWEGGIFLEPIATTQPKETSYDFGFSPHEGEQNYLYYTLLANNEVGSSNFCYIEEGKLIGKPYSLPFDECVIGGQLNGTFWHSQTADAQNSGKLIFNVESYDEEANSNSLFWQGKFDGDFLKLGTGKIDISQAEYPTLIFAAKSDKGKISISAKKPDSEEVFLKEITVDGNQWTTTKVDLSSLKSERYVIIYFNVESNSLLLDDIHVLDQLKHNLHVSIESIDEMKVGEETEINIRVDNFGSEIADSYSIRLTANNEELFNETSKEPLATMKHALFKATYRSSIFDKAEQTKLNAEIIYTKDLKPENNTIDFNIALKEPVVLPVESAQISQNNDVYTLNWTTPKIIVEEIVDDFESYQHTSLGGWNEWTTADEEKGYVMGLGNSLPMPHNNELYAYMLFDVKESGYEAFVEGITPHSGDKELLACFSVKELNTNEYMDQDNWLISPALPGIAQEISFYARSLTNQYGEETYEVLYSTSDKTINSFKKLAEGSVPADWTQIRIELPEGTNYFAIRHTTSGKDAFVFMLDDIKYVNTGGEIAGYNIYENGDLLTTTQQQTIVLENYKQENSYSISAVYANGCESRPTEAIDPSSIKAINSCTDTYDVYTIDGILIRSQVESLTGLEQGIYIIKNQNKCTKMFVH